MPSTATHCPSWLLSRSPTCIARRRPLLAPRPERMLRRRPDLPPTDPEGHYTARADKNLLHLLDFQRPFRVIFRPRQKQVAHAELIDAPGPLRRQQGRLSREA